MNLNEVPQDELDYKERNKLRKLMYAVDKEGHYTGVTSVGWEAENVAMKEAWEDIEEGLSETLKAVKAGKESPLAYHMQKHLMDVSLLSKYAGIWQWRVKRHLRPEIFAKLSQKILSKYASALNISIDELKTIPENK
ncbi:MAG: hypothetical protein ABI378_07820 [Chitinophagaceae bacterium]